MTIATIGGAGNVGKTTVLEILGQEFARRNVPILSIDANPDQNLMEFAGIRKERIADTPKLCMDFDTVKMILEGDNPLYPDLSKFVATSPVTEHSKRWRFDIADDDIVKKFGVISGGRIFMHTGTYSKDRIGGGCMHDLIETLVPTVERVDDGINGERGIILIDQAHGRDAFGTPLYAQGDIALVVAEPTEKSLGILVDYIDMAQEVGKKIGHNIVIGVIGNKVKSEKQVDRIKNVAGDHYISSLLVDDAFDRDFDNAGPALSALRAENKQAVELIANKIMIAERNWDRRKDWLEACHFDAKWYDVFYGTEVRQQKTSYVPFKFSPHVHGKNCTPGCNL